MIWTKEMEDILRDLYSTHTNREIAELTGWDYRALMFKGKNMGIKKNADTRQRSAGITPWTSEQIAFLKDNFFSMTNSELGKAIGFTLTVVRNKTRELGLIHLELEYWTPEQVQFLQDHYRTMGDVEIVHYFRKHWPKKKNWRRQQVHQKRQYLGLLRTDQEKEVIIKRNMSAGGPCHTIANNSASKNLPDKYVANCLAWRNPELKAEVLKHPDIIQIKREQLLLSRAIKEVKNG